MMELGFIYMRSRYKRTIQGMQMQWFHACKEVQETEVNKHAVDICLQVQRCNTAIYYLEK
jgi:hypothetical protein